MFKCISKQKLMTLALKAGHKNEPPFGPPTHIIESDQMKYMCFMLAICEALASVNYDSMMLSMEGVLDIAKEHAGFEEYDMMNDPSGNVNMQKLIHSQQMCAFYERLTHLIAAELKKENNE